MTAIVENGKFGTSTAMTCTLASLASGSARETTAVDNTSNLNLDAMVSLFIKLQAGSPSGDKCVYVWAYGSEDGTNYEDNATGSDAAVTMRAPTNLRGPFVINMPDSGGLTYKGFIPSVCALLGMQVLPRKWGLVIQNGCGVTFSATEGDHTKTYTGITRQAA